MTPSLPRSRRNLGVLDATSGQSGELGGRLELCYLHCSDCQTADTHVTRLTSQRRHSMFNQRKSETPPGRTQEDLESGIGALTGCEWSPYSFCTPSTSPLPILIWVPVVTPLCYCHSPHVQTSPTSLPAAPSAIWPPDSHASPPPGHGHLGVPQAPQTQHVSDSTHRPAPNLVSLPCVPTQ